MKKVVLILAGIGLLGLIACAGLLYILIIRLPIQNKALGGPREIRQINARPPTRGFIGLNHESISTDRVATLEIEGGVVITQVLPGGPADMSGIAVGDYLIEADGRTILGREGLMEFCEGWLPDQVVSFKIIRFDGDTRIEQTFEIKTISFAAIQAIQLKYQK